MPSPRGRRWRTGAVAVAVTGRSGACGRRRRSGAARDRGPRGRPRGGGAPARTRGPMVSAQVLDEHVRHRENRGQQRDDERDREQGERRRLRRGSRAAGSTGARGARWPRPRRREPPRRRRKPASRASCSSSRRVSGDSGVVMSSPLGGEEFTGEFLRRSRRASSRSSEREVAGLRGGTKVSSRELVLGGASTRPAAFASQARARAGDDLPSVRLAEAEHSAIAGGDSRTPRGGRRRLARLRTASPAA